MKRTPDHLSDGLRRLSNIEGVDDVRIVRIDGTECIRVRVSRPDAVRRLPGRFLGLEVVLVATEHLLSTAPPPKPIAAGLGSSRGPRATPTRSLRRVR